MPSKRAAYLVSEKAHRLDIRETPEWTPSENEILIKNRAIAVNPIDGYIQKLAFFPKDYPTILGSDVAGEVVVVGSDVTRFKEGDRVVGHAPGVVTNKHSESAFQEHVILQTNMTSEIPEDMSYERAAVIPLGISTAACALFQEAPLLGMQYPTEPAQKLTGKTVLIWGGSSSVGSNGIQLSIAAGYEVIATASPKNFEMVKKLGASQVLDYNNPSAVDDVVAACKGKTMAGAFDCIGGSAEEACVQVMHKVDGNRTIVTVKPPTITPPEGVSFVHVFGGALLYTELGPAIYRDFLPKALKSGSYVPAPEPMVVGEGLEKVQEGIDILFRGVSATKVVITL